MTAVFKKPLSKIRKPLLVSFSSLSPAPLGAATLLNAVAGMLLSVILQIPNGIEMSVFLKDDDGNVRYNVCFSSSLIHYGQRIFVSSRIRGLPHGHGQSLG
jgi:hypothetical protein